MALFERLRSQEAAKVRGDRFSWNVHEPPVARDAYQEFKSRVHHKLIEKLDLSNIETLSRDQLHGQVKLLLEEMVKSETLPLSRADRERLVEEVVHETLGLGPIEPLLADPTVSDILVNGSDQVYIERFGKLELTTVRFKDDAHVRQIIDRIVAAVGRRVDESSPMVDARLPDGSRVNAIIPPLAIDGPVLSIRRFGANPLTANDFLSFESITGGMLELLKGAVKARLNLLISGGTGAGKTTLLNILSSYIPEEERIVTIEDAAELQLQQEHVVRLETRPPNIEGRGKVNQRDLVRNALRMRPDRIIVGEVRGDEALDMLQAMNTGHDGSLTTVHANSPRDSLSRLETMVLMAGLELPEKAIREQISSALDVVVQISRLSDGRRKVTNVSEIVGMEGSVVTMQDIFVFERMGVAEDGTVLGRFKPTGIRPKFAERLFLSGVHLPPGIFDDV
ncbi:MAG: CpaF family protein [Candidatus Eisenbacteria bacterium]|nr:CpaF family protein [Candidatus Eisenbacteria bacterium]